MLERDGDAVGDDAQEPIRARVQLPCAPADLEHADRAAPDDERRHHQRANAGRARRATRHARIRGRPVLDQHGGAGGDGDASDAFRSGDGQLRERDVDADRRARVQLVPHVIGEVERREVGVEDVGRDLDDALQEDVRAHRGQARLGDLAERLELARAPFEEPAGDERSRPREELLGQERLRHLW